MKPNHFSFVRHRFATRRGFALVVTLSLMVLLTVIAIGLLGLSTITLRSASQGEAAALARGNARLAVILAVGELQTVLGSDRSVSAPASSVIPNADRPHLTGAWESWRWEPSANGAPPYSQKAGRFRRWLVSTPDPAAAASFNLPARGASGDVVELVGDYPGSRESTSVQAEKVRVGAGASRGSLAWAVFDENTKASIDIGDPPGTSTVAESLAARIAPPRFRADIVDSAFGSLAEPEHLVSLETAVIEGRSGAEKFRGRFHDFTTDSLGLLTDVASGGLKTDLTSLLEPTTFPATSFPGDTLYFDVGSGAPRWRYLHSHYRKYKTMQLASNGTPSYRPATTELQPFPAGLDSSPQQERLMPVIGRFQLVFSIVSHHAHISNRMEFLNTRGEPRGNNQHAVPHLAYDPVITLYNPYDVALDLANIRIRISDPPVGFRFQKIDRQSGASSYYRPEMAAGEFHGLAMFQIANERNRNARKSFTLMLGDGTPDRLEQTLRLLPGEVKVFSARVETNWTWGLETQNGVRSFFDWNVDDNFGNEDKRHPVNRRGVEAIPGWDARAGLQTDHLSYGGRPSETLYAFERNSGGGQESSVGGYVSLRLSDEVRVEARPERMTGNAGANVPDFQIDLLANRTDNPQQDLMRSYRFRFNDLIQELAADPDDPVISRTFLTGDTLQAPNDNTAEGKKTFAMLEMSIRTTKDELDDTKPWLYNNPVIEGGELDYRIAGPVHQSHDLRLIPMSGITGFPDGIDIDPDTYRGYYGASRGGFEGSSNVPMARIPLLPAASLGDWVHSNLVASAYPPRVMHPLGNARAHPLIPENGIARMLGTRQALDHSYLLNDALWDAWYFSSITDYNAQIFGNSSRSRQDVLRDVLSGAAPALNSRLAPLTSPGDANKLAGELSGLNDSERARRLAAHLGIRGAFNVNSTSVDAWRALLSSLRDRTVTGWNGRSDKNSGVTAFVRMGMPLAGSADDHGDSSADVLGQVRWAGFRTLDDGQIGTLAEAIVAEIQARGNADKAPSLSLGEFVNRRPGSNVHSLAGLLQTAIDKSGINNTYHMLDSKPVGAALINEARKMGVVTPQVMDGYSAEGAPPMLTQGDLMAAIAPVVTVRGDTFKIRGYGEALSVDGSRVLARAWCEVVVQRTPHFLDSSEDPETPEADLGREINRTFGRRFSIVSFRWMQPDEV